MGKQKRALQIRDMRKIGKRERKFDYGIKNQLLLLATMSAIAIFAYSGCASEKKKEDTFRVTFNDVTVTCPDQASFDSCRNFDDRECSRCKCSNGAAAARDGSCK